MDPANTKAKKILLIEDENSLVQALDLKLSASGFQVSVVATGKDALAIVEREQFDFILLDKILPIMDGFAVLRKLREMGVKTPVIVLANLFQEGETDKLKALGALDCIVKSKIQLTNILEYLNKILL